MHSITKLKEMYARNSKHSHYQILSDKLASIIGKGQIEVKSRYERERLDYILRNIPIEGKSILDIGGNSGFFTFEAIERGAKSVHYYEGNKVHSNFVRTASEALRCAHKIEITNDYYSFGIEDSRKYDVIFLLNVLHHLGDDFGDKTISIEVAKKQMMISLNNLSRKTSQLVFQLGFNWKGNRNICLFKNGTKKELIDFVTISAKGTWEIRNIGIPVRKNGDLTYVDLDNNNIERDDALGEFLNRPMFILEAK